MNDNKVNGKLVKGILLLFILFLGTACQAQAPLDTQPTAIAAATPVPVATDIKYPHADCEILPPEASEPGQDEFIVWILVEGMQDMLSISVDDAEMYRCQNILPDPITGEQHGFRLNRPAGELLLQLEDVARGLSYSETLQIQAETWVIINYIPSGQWQVRATEEQPLYE
ncbi:hypothetical protein [Candidatus Leptofilum sp.]|uniref:hypothetical protein n=1 Tax=Candidatus Leptofilum sp. TaxID=3241576 RepID=UPI003B5CE719